MHHYIESRLTITIYIVETFISYLNPEENITKYYGKKTQIHIIYCTLLNTIIVRKSCFCNNLVTFREVPKSVLAYIWG